MRQNPNRAIWGNLSMVLFRDDDGQLRRDRRTAGRAFVIREAELVVDGCAQSGVVTDLSETGARVEVKSPPAVDARAELRWQDNACGCTVQWAEDDSCGLAFDENLPADVFNSSIGRKSPAKRSGKARARLTVGRKRTGSILGL